MKPLAMARAEPGKSDDRIAAWQMQGATEQMTKLLDAPKLDETKVLAQVDKMSTIEHEFKRPPGAAGPAPESAH